MSDPNSSTAVGVLADNHRAFFRYLERRVGDRALAEDILHDALARVAARPELAPPDDAVIPWFYRVLRNATIDRFRRREAAERAYQEFARGIEPAAVPDALAKGEICGCVSRIAATLKPEYAEALTAIEVEGRAVKAFADEKGLTAGNAAVRVFRARESLKKRVLASCGACAERGCLDCTCGS